MARMSIDDQFLRDPRVRVLASLCGWSVRETRGCLLDVWAVCYDRMTPELSRAVIDVAAERPGFADLLLESELGAAAIGKVKVAGVEERIGYLVEQRRRGQMGGKRRAENLAALHDPLEANAAAPLQHPLKPLPDSVPDDLPDPVLVPDALPETRAWDAGRFVHLGWERFTALHTTLKSELGLKTVRPLHPQDPGVRELLERVRGLGESRATADFDHVLAVLEGEARKTNSLKRVNGSAFQERAWRWALSRDPSEVGGDVRVGRVEPTKGQFIDGEPEI